jgi:MFS family permease
MELLRQRGFLLLWTGQFLVTFATWALRTILLIWVYQLTRSGIAVSVVGLAEVVPLLVLALLAGVLVDRWNRAYTMAGATLAAALLLLPLLAITGRSGLPLIVIVAVCTNSAGQLFMTAAGAALPVVVGQESIGQANGLISLENGGIAVTAPGVAALLYAAVGPHAAVAVVVVVFLLAVPILAVVPAPRSLAEGVESTSVAREMADGLRYVRRSQLLMSLVAIAAVAALGFGALSVLDVVFVTRALHLQSATVGLLLTASGLGELSGGILMSVFGNRMGRRYHLVLGLTVIVGGTAFLGYAVAPNLWVAAVALAVVGLMFPPIIVSFMTMVQWVTDDAFMGRVNSVINTSMAVMMIMSLVSGGALTDLFGVRQVIAGAAVLLGASGVLSLFLIRTTPAPRVAAIDEPVQIVRSELELVQV